MRFEDCERAWEARRNTPPDDEWEPAPWSEQPECKAGLDALEAAIGALDETRFADLRELLSCLLDGYRLDNRYLHQLSGSLRRAWEIGSRSYDCDAWAHQQRERLRREEEIREGEIERRVG